VIHGVTKGLFNGGKWIVEKTVGFRPIRVFNDLFQPFPFHCAGSE
jgi:hypothetical protein